ncbi:hypothetical protein POTOM_061598 [Populus tomentosa]|uniref:Uncharacterized protein n=1 Tax=Populus tomentosa TaxID=118781 RepID=A0A8X8C044_POPTO|nr:hypothetical protein POTOM_061598 [Populus tomentosa]
MTTITFLQRSLIRRPTLFSHLNSDAPVFGSWPSHTFLALARQIHQATGFKISIASTPLNIQYLSSTFNSSSDEPENDHIHLLELPFCSTDNDLPPNTENSENLSLDSIGKLLSASLSLRKPFHSLVSDIAAKQGHPPLCIISDVFLGWATEVASSLGTVNVTFATSGAYGTLASSSLWLIFLIELHHFLRNADGTDSWSKFFQSQFSLSMQSFGWLCNTAEEFEPAGLEWLRNFVKLPDKSLPDDGVSHWLGRECEPFIWVIRPPVGLNQKVNLEQNTYQKDLKKEWRKENKRSAGQHRFEGGEESDRVVMAKKVKEGDLRSKAMVIKEQLRASVRDEGEDKDLLLKLWMILSRPFNQKGRRLIVSVNA